MNREIQQRLTWVKLYQELGDAGLVCLRCGISRPSMARSVADVLSAHVPRRKILISRLSVVVVPTHVATI